MRCLASLAPKRRLVKVAGEDSRSEALLHAPSSRRHAPLVLSLLRCQEVDGWVAWPPSPLTLRPLGLAGRPRRTTPDLRDSLAFEAEAASRRALAAGCRCPRREPRGWPDLDPVCLAEVASCYLSEARVRSLDGARSLDTALDSGSCTERSSGGPRVTGGPRGTDPGTSDLVFADREIESGPWGRWAGEALGRTVRVEPGREIARGPAAPA